MKRLPKPNLNLADEIEILGDRISGNSIKTFLSPHNRTKDKWWDDAMKCRLCKRKLTEQNLVFGLSGYDRICIDCVEKRVSDTKLNLKHISDQLDEWQKWFNENKENLKILDTINQI